MSERVAVAGKWQSLDRPLFLTTIALVGIGLLLIYSADNALFDSAHFEKQLTFAIAGFIFMMIATIIPTRYYFALAYIVFGIAVVMLLMVPVVGVTALGAKRWISIGGFNFQPSEPAKLFFLIAAARFLSGVRPDQTERRALIGVVLIAALPFMLVLSQPDLGTSSLFPVIGAVLLAWWGLPLWYYLLAAMPFVAMFLGVFPWLAVPLELIGFWWMKRAGMRWLGLSLLLALVIASTFVAATAWSKLEPYQQNRLTTFIDPGADPLGAGYQIIQSKVAIGSGGVIGSGWLQGTQTQLRFLPQQHTDFIFALAGEEFGLWGTTSVLLLFFVYGWRGVKIATRARSQFAGLMAIGITTITLYHAAVNIGMAIGVMPVTGIPLPFISYGGTFLMTCMVNTGILLSTGIYRRE